MNKERFKFLEHVADAYIEAYGKSLEEAFENAAVAMFEVMTDTKKISKEFKEEIKFEADDKYQLLHDLLSTLLVKFETESKLYSSFHINPIRKEGGKLRLEAEVLGEFFKPEKHPSKGEVKAVTHHKMEIKHECHNDRMVVRFILDL